MYTEEVARTKWCPAYRRSAVVASSGPLGTDNRGDNEAVNCLGSRCMAWRWSRGKETEAYLNAVQARMKTTGENFNTATNKVYAEVGSTFEQTEGYCGLAGTP